MTKKKKKKGVVERWGKQRMKYKSPFKKKKKAKRLTIKLADL